VKGGELFLHLVDDLVPMGVMLIVALIVCLLLIDFLLGPILRATPTLYIFPERQRPDIHDVNFALCDISDDLHGHRPEGAVSGRPQTESAQRPPAGKSAQTNRTHFLRV
jgi:hypothetical protein